MPRKLKYGLKTKMKRVPIVLDEIIDNICLEYGYLNEIDKIKYLKRLNIKTRKDKKVCPNFDNCLNGGKDKYCSIKTLKGLHCFVRQTD